jgi:hypothetical protein
MKRSVRTLTSLSSLLVPPVLLALAGAICRWTIRVGIETRFQILGFILLAIVIEIGAEKPRWLRFALSVSLVTTAMIAMKVQLEGVSPNMLHVLRQLGLRCS